MIFSGGGFIDALLIIGLPNGPTAHFKLSKLVLRKDIKVSCFFCQKLYVYLFSNIVILFYGYQGLRMTPAWSHTLSRSV